MIVYAGTSNLGKLREFKSAAPDFDVRTVALPPFLQQQLEHPNIHAVASSFELAEIAKAKKFLHVGLLRSRRVGIADDLG